MCMQHGACMAWCFVAWCIAAYYSRSKEAYASCLNVHRMDCVRRGMLLLTLMPRHPSNGCPMPPPPFFLRCFHALAKAASHFLSAGHTWSVQISLLAIREGAADLLVQLLTVASPDIRAAAVFGLGCLVHSGTLPAGGSGAGDEQPMPVQPPTQVRVFFRFFQFRYLFSVSWLWPSQGFEGSPMHGCVRCGRERRMLNDMYASHASPHMACTLQDRYPRFHPLSTIHLH